MAIIYLWIGAILSIDDLTSSLDNIDGYRWYIYIYVYIYIEMYIYYIYMYIDVYIYIYMYITG